MTIRLVVRRIQSAFPTQIVEFEAGKYNEFYLPSININEEAWLTITDDDGDVTTLHLKR